MVSTKVTLVAHATINSAVENIYLKTLPKRSRQSLLRPLVSQQATYEVFLVLSILADFHVCNILFIVECGMLMALTISK